MCLFIGKPPVCACTSIPERQSPSCHSYMNPTDEIGRHIVRGRMLPQAFRQVAKVLDGDRATLWQHWRCNVPQMHTLT